MAFIKRDHKSQEIQGRGAEIHNGLSKENI
jgi:hypothetical protein